MCIRDRSNGFPEFFVFGTEKNLQIDIWSMRHLPNFPELSLKPKEFDLYSEFSSILSVEIVDARREELNHNSILLFVHFLGLRSLVLRQALLPC